MCSTRYRLRAATKRNILFSKFRSLISPVINQFVHDIESSMTDHEIPEIQTCTVCKISALVLTAVELSRPVGSDNFKCLLAIKCKLPETKYQLQQSFKTYRSSRTTGTGIKEASGYQFVLYLEAFFFFIYNSVLRVGIFFNFKCCMISKVSNFNLLAVFW